MIELSMHRIAVAVLVAVTVGSCWITFDVVKKTQRVVNVNKMLFEEIASGDSMRLDWKLDNLTGDVYVMVNGNAKNIHQFIGVCPAQSYPF